jgi:alkaline phosphatase D
VQTNWPFRQFLRENLNRSVILTNGDRHWGLHEFGCGPASDIHAISPSESYHPRYHKFLRTKGGYLSLSVNAALSHNHLVIERRAVNGEVVYRRAFQEPDPKKAWA